MKFLREDMGTANQAVAKAICDGLFAGKRVLWLVSGGSNIAAEKAIMYMVSKHAGGHLGGLAILPIDERYGDAGHKDSNAQQLRAAGFDAAGATFVDVLMHNFSFEQTISFYTDVASAALANAGLVVGQFGIGADGHIAGIKPDSPASDPIDESLVSGYEWEDYTRITLMPAALKQINIAYVLAYGADKRSALTKLKQNKVAFKKLPAVLLYEITDVFVYNDQLESKG